MNGTGVQLSTYPVVHVCGRRRLRDRCEQNSEDDLGTMGRSVRSHVRS